MKRIAIVLLMTISVSVAKSDDDTDETKRQIESLLTIQDEFWNAEDIEGFMRTYWKSDRLTFSGGGETTRGWQATLDRYKERYPSGKMGKLHFDHLETTMLSPHVALVLGNWHLDINGQKKDGNFSLVLKKFGDAWKIIHDHSSTLESEKGWLTVPQAEQVAQNHLRTESLTSKPQGHYLQVVTVGENASTIYVNRKTAAIVSTPPSDLGDVGK